jgi:excisionase family DNA binding protein
MADDELETRRGTLRRDTLVGLPQVARELGIGVRLVQRAIEAGQLPAYRVGVHRRVRVADVQTWLAGCRERR